jgi:hypothetical protein
VASGEKLFDRLSLNPQSGDWLFELTLWLCLKTAVSVHPLNLNQSRTSSPQLIVPTLFVGYKRTL